MTEGEKIKQLIGEAYDEYCNSLIAKRKEGKTLCDFIADKLVENGIRDINQKGLVAVEGEVSIVPENIIADVKAALDGKVEEWKRKASSFDILRSGPGKYYPHDNIMLYKGENVEKIAQERDKWRRRAEIAERNDKIMDRALTMACLDKASTYYPNKDEKVIAVIFKDEYLRQAVREIEENKE